MYKIGKNPCKKCQERGMDRSGDNFYFYGEGLGGYCHACGYTVPSDEYKERNGFGYEYNEEFESMSALDFNEEVHNKLKAETGLDSKGYRGIRTDISRYFGVRYQYSEVDGSVTKTLYPCTQNYEISGYKVRNHPKDFRGSMGTVGADADLFMQFRFKNPTNKTVIIACGEHDALATFQMMSDFSDKKGYEDKIAVVSSTIGESGSYKQFVKQYDWFDQFSKIIYIPDQDEAGIAAMHKISEVLPKGKMHVMNLPEKDANKMLIEGREKEFISAFYNAKPYSPDGVVGSSSLSQKIRESASMEKVPLPPFMHKVQSLMAGGIPLARIVNLGAASGAGKSTISEECVYHWIFHSPYRVGVVSLESDAGEYGLKLLSRHIGRKIDLIEDDDEKMELLDSPEVVQKEYELFHNENGTDRFHLVDERDGGVESLKKTVENLVIKCECKLIILDPLQDILDGLSNEEQALFLKWQKGLVKSHKVTFININHIRKSGGGTEANSTGANIHEEDFQGSSAIFKSAACNLLFTRNKEAETLVERNTTNMKMTKCRWTGRTDPHAGKYYYCNETHTLYDFDDYMEAHPDLLQVKVDF